MILEVKKRALNTMASISDWIGDQNTEGAGDRWLEKAIEELKGIAASEVKHAICKDPRLARYQYRCFTYNDKWVVAYRIERNRFIVYRFIYGPWLDYR
jgi:hypothetical protein